MSEVAVIIGAGGIGQAIARRQGVGRIVLLADLDPATLAAATSALEEAGYAVVSQTVDVTSRPAVAALADKAASLGAVTRLINTAGLSPNMAPPAQILAVDLYAPAMVFEEFERVIAPGGSALIVASMAGHMRPALSPAEDIALATTPAEELLALPMLDATAVPDSMVAYGLAKRANSLRVKGAAPAWGDRGARINAISPGIVATPLARHEMTSPVGDIYRTMIAISQAKRMAPPDEIAAAADFLLDSPFITGADLLIDGGVVAAMAGGRMAAAL